jgi:hypothetical protein
LTAKVQAKSGADASGDGFSDAANAGAQDADVVDADFEEIKDDDKK